MVIAVLSPQIPVSGRHSKQAGVPFMPGTGWLTRRASLGVWALGTQTASSSARGQLNKRTHSQHVHFISSGPASRVFTSLVGG